MTKQEKVTVTNHELTDQKSNRGRKAGAIIFPRDPLKKILNVGETIWTQNAGNPMPILDIAAALKESPTSSSFKRRLASSLRYGLTEGSPWTKIITLTQLGRSIVAPTVNDNPQNSLRKALLNSEVFNKFYTMFDDKPMPREEILKNTLANPQENGGFGIPRYDVPDFLRVVMANIQDYGLSHDIQGTPYMRLSKLSPAILSEPKEGVTDDNEEQSEQENNLEKSEPHLNEEKQIPRVFITHSKNKKILDQLKEMLKFGELEFRIAEEKETTAIPIPEKVFGLMRECNCAIINISADDEMKQEDGAYRINENVLIEIGGAFIHYDKRVILLVDKRITLPSNLQGLYRCEYEGDELSWTVAMKLQKALAEFKEKI